MQDFGRQNPTPPSAPTAADGFTFVEIITVVFILGIVSTIVVSRLFFSSNDLVARTEVIKSHLRYAQARAMNAEVLWGIDSDGGHYWLFQNGDTNDKVLLPGETSATVDLTGQGLSLTTFILTFDEWGKPYSDAAATRLLTADQTLTLGDGSQNRRIIVTRNTGFIE